MPDLVDLFLGDALASTGNLISSAEFDTLKRINLPCFSQLLVIAPLSTIITFLSSMNILVYTQIRLHSSDLGECPLHDNYAQFCSALVQHYSSDQVLSLPIICSAAIKPNPSLCYDSPLFFSFGLIFSFLAITHPFHIIDLLTTLAFVIASFHPLPRTSMTHSCLPVCTSL